MSQTSTQNTPDSLKSNLTDEDDEEDEPTGGGGPGRGFMYHAYTPTDLAKSVLTPEEQRKLIKGIQRWYWDRPSVRFVLAGTLYGGLRRSELSHTLPKWLGSGFVSIPIARKCTRKCRYCRKLFNTSAYPDDMTFTWHSKTTYSHRVVPIEDIGKLFDEYILDHADLDPFDDLERFVDEKANGLMPVLSHAQIYAICTQRFSALVGRYIHPHSLRATCATNLAIAGLGKREVDGIMGWSPWRDTALHYINFANRRVEMSNMRIRRDGLVKYTWIARGPGPD